MIWQLKLTKFQLSPIQYELGRIPLNCDFFNYIRVIYYIENQKFPMEFSSLIHGLEKELSINAVRMFWLF